MIFLQLFLTFLKIGAFTFGGGYAMVALIESEVVSSHHWLDAQEFTDILAVSQSTPGPIGINTATYTGYMAVIESGYSQPYAVLGALLASLAVVLIPIALMLVVGGLLMRYRNDKVVSSVMGWLRLVVVGLIASAAIALLTQDNFGSPHSDMRHFLLSIVIFLVVFLSSVLPKKESSKVRRPGPIAWILLAGLAGWLL